VSYIAVLQEPLTRARSGLRNFGSGARYGSDAAFLDGTTTRSRCDSSIVAPLARWYNPARRMRPATAIAPTSRQVCTYRGVDSVLIHGYTRSGLEVSFRPHSGRFTKPRNGKKPKHAKTRSFFSSALLYGKPEIMLREDGHKWEPCLHHEERLRSKSLSEPCFDIYYHHRESGMKVVDPQPIPYAFVVSLKAPKVSTLYNQVVRAYANILVPLQPQTRIHIRPRR